MWIQDQCASCSPNAIFKNSYAGFLVILSMKHQDEIFHDMVAVSVHSSTVTIQVPLLDISRDCHATFPTKKENWRKY